MLVKYLGTYFDKNLKTIKVRDSFLTDGLFRITQPKFLNDKGSEFRLYPYFNEFSPSDYAWAMKKYREKSVGNYSPSKNELESFYLKPVIKRYGEEFPNLLVAEGFNSIDEYDKKEFETTVDSFNKIIIELLSCNIGILSLCQSDTNEHMWTHYASEGTGIAVVFDENHLFFKNYPFRQVRYNKEDRASLSYYKGVVRINGERIRSLRLDSELKTSILLSGLYDPIVSQDFCERLVYTKSPNWSVEDEVRILFDIKYRDSDTGVMSSPDLDEKVTDFYSGAFIDYPTVCLKKIPFEAIKNVILGFSISIDDEQKIIQDISNNPELSHVKLKRAMHDVFGEITLEDI
jgi:hypothetical protein